MTPHGKKIVARVGLLSAVAGIILAVIALGRVSDARDDDGGFGVTGPTDGTLYIVSPHWEGIRMEFMRGFNAWRRAQGKLPVRIEWLDFGGTSDIVRYIRSTFSASPSGIDIDIFFGGGLDPYIALEAEGLLAPCDVPEEIMQHIPPYLHGVPLYSPENNWYGAALSGFGILYNKVVIERFDLPTPKTWEDLTDPRLRTWVGSADLRKSGSIHMIFEIILQAYGWTRGMEIVSAMAGNVRGFTQSAGTVPKDVALGEVAVGLCIDVYAWNTMDEVGGDRLGFVMPEGLTVVNPDAIALLRGAPSPELAQEFISFVLSEAGQKIWMLKVDSVPGAPVRYQLNKMPVWPSLYKKFAGHTYFTESPFDWEKTVVYDAQKGSARWNILNDYIGTLFIDAHPLCAAAWRRLNTVNLGDDMRALFFAHPLTEAELMDAAAGPYADTRWRTRTLSEWANDARRRYQTIISAPAEK